MHTLGDAAGLADALTWRLLALRRAAARGSPGTGQSAPAGAGGWRRRYAWSLAAARVATARAGPDRSGLPGKRRPAATRPERSSRAVDVFMVQHAITTGQVPAAVRVLRRAREGSREPLMEFRSQAD